MSSAVIDSIVLARWRDVCERLAPHVVDPVPGAQTMDNAEALMALSREIQQAYLDAVRRETARAVGT